MIQTCIKSKKIKIKEFMKNNNFRMSKSIILRVFESIILIVFNIVWKYESRKNFLVDRERERGMTVWGRPGKASESGGHGERRWGPKASEEGTMQSQYYLSNSIWQAMWWRDTSAFSMKYTFHYNHPTPLISSSSNSAWKTPSMNSKFPTACFEKSYPFFFPWH